MCGEGVYQFFVDVWWQGVDVEEGGVIELELFVGLWVWYYCVVDLVCYQLIVGFLYGFDVDVCVIVFDFGMVIGLEYGWLG